MIRGLASTRRRSRGRFYTTRPVSSKQSHFALIRVPGIQRPGEGFGLFPGLVGRKVFLSAGAPTIANEIGFVGRGANSASPDASRPRPPMAATADTAYQQCLNLSCRATSSTRLRFPARNAETCSTSSITGINSRFRVLLRESRPVADRLQSAQFLRRLAVSRASAVLVPADQVVTVGVGPDACCKPPIRWGSSSASTRTSLKLQYEGNEPLRELQG